MARWREPAPPFSCDLAAYIDLYLINPQPVWRGQSSPTQPYLILQLHQDPVTQLFQLTLQIAAPPIFYNVFAFDHQFIDTSKPLDTGLQYVTMITDLNSRLARVML